MSPPDDRRVVSLPADAGKTQPETKSRPKSSESGPGHSDIFERLSAYDENDLVGLVAYGLYQRRKRAWIIDYHAKNGRFPTQAERDGYAFSYRESALNGMRTDAEGALAAFGEQVAQEQIETLRSDALSLQTQAVLTGIDTKLENRRIPSSHHRPFGGIHNSCWNSSLRHFRR